jgi:hypothetical protein
MGDAPSRPEFVTEFYPTDRRRRTDSYMCYVGVIDDAAADESDVAPTVFDDSSVATPPIENGLREQRCSVLS